MKREGVQHTTVSDVPVHNFNKPTEHATSQFTRESKQVPVAYVILF